MGAPDPTGAGRVPTASDDEPDYRFTLANERTLLAWNRTAIALIAGGLGVTQLELLDQRALQITSGIGLAASGGMISLAAYRRLARNDAAIRRGDPLPPSSLPKMLVAVVVLGALVGVVMLLLLI